MTQKIDVYQVLLDIGQHIPGILVVNPKQLDKKTYDYHKQNHEVYTRFHDIQLDFGISNNSFRFAGITDNYMDIYDLVVKMIDIAVDQTSKGLMINNKMTDPKPELIQSVNDTNLYVPVGFPLPTGLSKMFRDPSTVHSIDFKLPQVGRLANIIKAGNYNLTHIDIYDKERLDKERLNKEKHKSDNNNEN